VYSRYKSSIYIVPTLLCSDLAGSCKKFNFFKTS